MKEPKHIPLNPEAPRSKKVETTPMPQLYADRMEDDVYIRPDNDSIYIPVEEKLQEDENH
jgi:hypothetical protein